MEGLNRETKNCKEQLLFISDVFNCLTVNWTLNFRSKLSGIHRLDEKINVFFPPTPNEASVSMPWELLSNLPF